MEQTHIRGIAAPENMKGEGSDVWDGYRCFFVRCFFRRRRVVIILLARRNQRTIIMRNIENHL